MKYRFIKNDGLPNLSGIKDRWNEGLKNDKFEDCWGQLGLALVLDQATKGNEDMDTQKTLCTALQKESSYDNDLSINAHNDASQQMSSFSLLILER